MTNTPQGGQFDLSKTVEINPETQIFRHKSKKKPRKSTTHFVPYQSNNLVTSGYVTKTPSPMNEAIKAQLDNLTKIYQEIREILLRIQIRQTAMCSLQVNTTKETTQQLNNQDEVIGRLLNVVNTLCVQNNCPPSEPIPEMPPPPVLDHVAIFNADIMARGLEPLELTETMGDYFAEGEDFAQFLTRTDMEECNVNLLQELSRIESEDPSLIVF